MIKNPLKKIFINHYKVAKNFGLDLNLRPQNLNPLIYYNLTRELEKLRN